MAEVCITRRWPDEETLVVSIVIENDYPDALEQAKRTVVDMLREATEVIIPTEAETP